MAIQGLVTNGWLAVFAAGPDGRLGYMSQTARNNVWSEWEAIGPLISGDPTVFHNPDGRVEIFAKGADGQLGHMWQLEGGAGWSEWEELGVELQGDPVLAHNADGRLEVFGRGPGDLLGHIWHTEPDHGWADWEAFGPAISGNPAVFQNADGHLELFAAAKEGPLGHLWQHTPSGLTGWSGWEELGPDVSGNPALFLNEDGNLEVFAVGPGGMLGHRWQTQPDHGWSEWEELGPEIVGNPALFLNTDGHLEVFARGPDQVLGHRWQTEPDHGWSDWVDLGPAISSDPGVFQNSDGRLEVFGIGEGGKLGHLWQFTPSGIDGWSEWEELGPKVSAQRPAIGQMGSTGGGVVDADFPVPKAAAVLPPAELTADVCVIGGGPAGITVCDGLIRAGASVVLIESGGLDENPKAQALNDGLADGPIIKRRWTYLRDGRRRAVQGSASRWGMGWLMPFREIDFAERPWVQDSGWPFGAEEMAPYQERATETFAFDPFPEPQAEGSLVRVSYHFPPDPLLFRARYLDLLAKPRFHPELGATALDLHLKGDRVESVRCVGAEGQEIRVSAGTMVLAAGGVENARFLLLNERTLSPTAMTGRNFMEHPHVLAGSVELPGRDGLESLLEWGNPTLDVLGLGDEVQRSESLLNASVQVRPGDDGRSNSGPFRCDLYVRAEQAPNPESRVVLGHRTDAHGARQPILHWRVLEQDWSSVVRTASLVGAALEERHGAKAELSINRNEAWPFDPTGPDEARNSTWGNHHMGTTRMGTDPADSVVDPDGRLHGAANLYVAGSSVFPTGSCANPTFTIVALAHRLVDHLTAKA